MGDPSEGEGRGMAFVTVSPKERRYTLLIFLLLTGTSDSPLPSSLRETLQLRVEWIPEGSCHIILERLEWERERSDNECPDERMIDYSCQIKDESVCVCLNRPPFSLPVNQSLPILQ